MFRDKVLHTLKNSDFRTVELEFRLGVQGETFCPNIPKQKWTKAQTKFKDGVETNTIELYVPTKPSESSRFVANATNNERYWEHKMKIANETKSFGEYSVRSALAFELKENGDPPKKVTLQRKKSRTTYTSGVWKIDFTRVESIPSKDRDCEESYEIEVELADLGYFFQKEIEMIIAEGSSLCKNILN